MVNISDWAQKKYDRITESKWTKMFILVSIMQLLVVIALEGRVLSRNMGFQREVVDIENSKRCDNLNKSKDRMSLITQENIIFMLFQAFQLWFCLNAVIMQNTIQIIALTITNFICALYGMVQIFEIIKWRGDLIDLCPQADGLIQKQFLKIDVPLVVVLIIFALIMAILSFKLYQQFGWNIYKKIGADIAMQKIYRTMLIFVMLLKLDLFFVLLLSIEVFFAFSEEKVGKIEFTFTLPKRLYYFHMVVTIMILFLELLAYRSVRNESKNGMIVYITLSTVVMIDFVLILRAATSTISNSWYFFIIFLSVAIMLSMATWTYAVLVFKNFEKGLEAILRKNKNKDQSQGQVIINDPEVGSSGRAGGTKFTIDD